MRSVLRESYDLIQEIHDRGSSLMGLPTGFTDIDSVISAINSGQVYRYVTKPWDPVDLANTVDKAIERYELSAELKEKNRALELALRDREPVHRYERPELEPVVVEDREDLAREELSNGFEQLGGRGERRSRQGTHAHLGVRIGPR